MFITFCSCNSSDTENLPVIKVNPEVTESVRLSNIALDAKKVFLETNDSCLISWIKNVLISTDHVFINDAGKRILQFDTSGNFIRQIGEIGRGPSEYTSVISMAIDKSKGIIYASDLKKVLCWDIDGKFISEIKQGTFSEYIYVDGNQLWTVSTTYGNKDPDGNISNIVRLIRFDQERGLIDTLILRKIIVRGLTGTLSQDAAYISESKDTRYIYCPVLVSESNPVIRDTLYEVRGKTIKPNLKIDFGKNLISQDGKKSITIHNIYIIGDFLFVEYVYKSNSIFYCYDHVQNINYNVLSGFEDDIFYTGTVRLKPLDFKNGYMFFSKESFELMKTMNGLSENSNPVLFIVKIKQESD